MMEIIEATCLIVTDDELIYKKLSDIFQRINFKVIIANSGEDAMEKAKNIPFNLAFVGEKLPDINGVSLVKNLKEIYPERNYIVISEDPSVWSQIDALRAGVDDYFIKPFDIEEIIRKTKEFVKNQFLYHKLKESEEKFRGITEQTFIGIAIVQDNKMVYCNQAVSDINEYSIDEMLTWAVDDILQIIHPEYRELVLNSLNEYQQTPNTPVSEIEFPVYSKKSELKWLHVNFKTIFYLDRNALLATLIDITEKKQAEIALMESEEKFRNLSYELETILDIIPGMFYCKDKNGVVTRTNLIFAESLNLRKSEIIGKTAFDLFPKDQAESFQKDDLEVINNGKPKLNIEESVDFPDGKIWAITNKIPYYSKDGDIKGIIGLSVDITEHKKIEQELKQSEDKFKRIFESNPDLFFLIDKDYTFLEYSGKEEDLYTTPENFLGKKVSELFPPELSKIFTNAFEKTFRTENPQIIEYKLLQKDGLHYFEAQILFFSEEKLAIFARDITERKIAEIALKESEEKFRSITEETFIGITIIQDNKIVYFNQAFIDIAGFPKDEILNWEINDIVRPIHQDHREMMLNYIITYQQDTDKPVFESEFPHYTKKSELKWVRVNLKTMIYREKNCLFVTTIDITERKKAEIALKESEEKFRKIFDSNPDLFFMIDKDSTFLDYSGKEEDFYIVPENFLGKKVSELFPPKLSKIFTETIEKTIRTENPQIIEYELPMIAGLHYYEARLLYFSKEKIAVFIRDITERKHSEIALKESEEKFREITEQTSIGVTILQDNKIVYSNKAQSNITGYSLEEILDLGGDDLILPIHEDYREKVLKFINDYQQDIKQPVSEIEFPFYNKKKGLKWILLKRKTIIYQQRYGILVTTLDISEKKQAELALRDSEEKFRRITEENFVGIVIVQNNKIVYGNQMISDITGISINEIIGWDVNDATKLVSEDLRKLVLDYINEYQMEPEKPVSELEFLIYSRNGEPKWLHGNFKTIIYQDKNALFATFIDITDKKQAEISLKESEEKFRNIAEQSLMGIIILQDGVFKYFNDRISEMNGYTAEEIKDWTPNEWVKSIYPDDREFVSEQARKKQAGDPDVIHQYRYRTIRKEGQIRWMEIFSKTIIYKGHSADLAMIIDITDKIEADQKLKESEQNFREIAEQTLIGYVILQDNRIKYSNKAHSDITGYSLEEILRWEGQKLLEPVHENYRELVSTYITKFQNSVEGLSAEVEFQYYTKKKEIKWIRTHIKTIFYQQRRAILISLIDITEQKKIEKLIKQEVQKLKDLDEIRNEFIDRSSHELKTPLTSVYSASSLFIDLFQNELSQKQLRLIKIIHNGAKRLDELVKNTLDLSRIDIGKLELNIKKVNLINLLRESLEELYYLILERNLIVHSELNQEVYIECDKTRIHQVIINILSNAVKNTPPYGKLYVRLNKTTTNVQIFISDTGVGFTMKEKTKIFQKFGKIERYGKGMDINTEGSGLGLFISKKIVDLHNGDIQIESGGRNKGTTCVITLPINFNPD